LYRKTLLRSAAKQFPSESSAVAQTERRHQPSPRFGSVAGGPRAQRGPYRGPRPRIQGLSVRDVAEAAIDGAIEVGTDPSRDLRVPRRANQLLPREPWPGPQHARPHRRRPLQKAARTVAYPATPTRWSRSQGVTFLLRGVGTRPGEYRSTETSVRTWRHRRSS
jgi:hypothetical protein